MALLNAPAEAERFFARLIMKVDDYGRFHADENLLSSLLYPGFDRNMRSIVRESLSFARERGLVVLYTDERGRKLLQINNFNQRTRSESKFPPPNDGQMTVNRRSNDRLDVCVVEGGGECEDEGGDVCVVRSVTWDRAAGWQGVSEKDLSLWKEAYPACELSRQLSEMHDWLLSNPAKAKKSNWRRFITNWLKRAQDRGGDKKSASGKNGQAFATVDEAHNNHRSAVAQSERRRAIKQIWVLQAELDSEYSDVTADKIESLKRQFKIKDADL